MTSTSSQKNSGAPGGKPVRTDASTPPVGALAAYLQGVRTEWTKISWPTGPQIWGQTIVVLVMVTFMTLCLFIIDNLIHFIISGITPHHG